jgi:uncharacterized protein YjhX (UPF0386 family)
VTLLIVICGGVFGIWHHRKEIRKIQNLYRGKQSPADEDDGDVEMGEPLDEKAIANLASYADQEFINCLIGLIDQCVGYRRILVTLYDHQRSQSNHERTLQRSKQEGKITQLAKLPDSKKQTLIKQACQSNDGDSTKEIPELAVRDMLDNLKSARLVHSSGDGQVRLTRNGYRLVNCFKALENR